VINVGRVCRFIYPNGLETNDGCRPAHSKTDIQIKQRGSRALWLARATLYRAGDRGVPIAQSVYVNGELVEGLSSAEHRNNKFLILPRPYVKLHILNADIAHTQTERPARGGFPH
jgi:hypothetical protein